MSEASENPLKIVDISKIDELTAEELLEAATTQGFLFIEGHGFSQQEVDELFELSKEFFELPKDYKEKYPINKNNHGYSKMGEEVLDPSKPNVKSIGGDPKEAMNFCCLNFETGASSDQVPSWFTDDETRLSKVQSGAKKLYKLSVRLLELLAIGLKIEDSEECAGKDWFSSRYHPTKESGTTFRFLHYPGQKSLNPEEVIRAGAHTDYGSMTLLFQRENQEGLEIYSPVAKDWQAVPFIKSSKNDGSAPPIIVNIADQLSFWTAGILKSTIHRVKFSKKVQETGQSRYSIVFFSHPNDETLLQPVPSKLVQAVKGRGANKEGEKIITAKEHLDKRLAATYGW